MNTHESLEIKIREAQARKTGLQKFANAGPYIILGLFILAPFLTLTTSQSGISNQIARDIFLTLLIPIFLLAFLNTRNQRRIDLLEIETLKLRRDLVKIKNDKGA